MRKMLDPLWSVAVWSLSASVGVLILSLVGLYLAQVFYGVAR